MVAGGNGVVLLIAAWRFCDEILVSIRYVGSLDLTASVFTRQ